MTSGTVSYSALDESTRRRLEVCWQSLVQRHGWSLIDDVDVWLDQIAASFRVPPHTDISDEEIRIGLRRAYSARLYAGIQNRNEQAVHELWLICYRLIRNEWGLEVAEDVAQETIKRVLEKLSMLRSPGSLIPWVFMILRTAFRDLRRHDRQIEASLDIMIASSMDFEDYYKNLVDEVEQKMLSEELMHLFRSKVPNVLERLIFLRVIFFGDKPRDVARDLNVSLALARLAKSRVLKRLRNDDDFLRLLGELAHA